MNDFLNKNVTVIIRTAGERTENICYNILKRQIAEENIHTIKEVPFANAVRKTLHTGVHENRRWTLAIDADVLLLHNVIEVLIRYADTVKKNVFEIEGKIIDKFLPSPRKGGIHLYRTCYMEQAIQYIPDPFQAIRPETHVKSKMKDNGYLLYVIETVVGYHDFEQSYRDIYRKCFIQAKKHNQRVNKILNQWRNLAEMDDDYKVALKGFEDGEKYTGAISIDSNPDYMQSFEQILGTLGLTEKGDIDDDYKKVLNGINIGMARLLDIKDKEISEKDKRIAKIIAAKEAEIAAKEAEIAAKVKQINTILNSYTYKIGNMATLPARKLFKK